MQVRGNTSIYFILLHSGRVIQVKVQAAFDSDSAFIFQNFLAMVGPDCQLQNKHCTTIVKMKFHRHLIQRCLRYHRKADAEHAKSRTVAETVSTAAVGSKS
jgi:hypothetical protein